MNERIHRGVVAAILTLLAAGRAAADGATATVEGLVRELGSPDPIPAAAVLTGTVFLAETDLDGTFTVVVPAGEIQMTFRAPGFAPVTRRFTLNAGDTGQLTQSLKRDVVEADEVVVRGRREAAEVSESRVLRDEIKVIPGTAGDPLRAVQSLPGVGIVNDFVGQMTVRGGGPNDNLYLLDRVPWPVPFHFGGIVSTVNPDLISSVDLHAGGFGAAWGNTQGAVLDATTRPGSHDRIHLSGDVNMVMSDGLLEGPLGLGNVSWTLAGRRTYFDLLLGRLTKNTFTAFPRFSDVGGSLDIPLGEFNHVRVLELTTNDLLAINLSAARQSDTRFEGELRWYAHADTVGASWVNTAVPGLTSTFTPYAYQNGTEFTVPPAAGIISWRTVSGAKEDAEWEAGILGNMKHTLRAGLLLERQQDQVNASIPIRTGPPGSPRVNVSTTVSGAGLNHGGYLEDRVEIVPGFAVTGGVRDDGAADVRNEAVSPRTSLEWASDPHTIWRAAWGRYDQLPTQRELNPQFGNANLRTQEADHAVIGYERTLSPSLFLKLEAYDKEFRYQVVRTDDATRYSNDGKGDARGVEVFLKSRTEGKFFGWISYALSRSRRRDLPGEPWHLYDYDQTHIGTALGSYRFTPALTGGAKLRMSSGTLYTPVVGSYQDSSGEWQPVNGPVNSARLPMYARLDLRVSYAFRNEGWKLDAYLEILNVLGRKNPFDLFYSNDYKTAEYANNFPRIPYLGVSFIF